MGLLFFLTASCKSEKELVYFRNMPDEMPLQEKSFSVNDYCIRPGDNLYIRVLSVNPDVARLFNPLSGGQSNSEQSQLYNSVAGIYLNGYQVGPDGTIQLPVVGQVAVAGKNMVAVQKAVLSKVDDYFKSASVTVKLLSFNYTVMGEVGHPGVYSCYTNHCTILEAISQASGTTDYSSLKKVMIIRRDGQKALKIHLDLTNPALLNSPGYYIHPADVIYVTPDRYKNTRLNASLYALLLSTLSTMIVLLKFIGG